MYGRVQHSRKYRAVYGHDPRPDRANPTVASRIENAADAALISAAPDLLAAAKAALPLLEEYRERVMRGRITGDLLEGDCEPTMALRKSIVKAEGGAA